MTLNATQIEQFKAEGFLVVRGGLEDRDLDPVIREYEAYIDQRARELKAEGKIAHLHEEEPFERRLACICRQHNALYRELDIMFLRGRASFDFLRNENLLDLVEGIVGPEITCNPIQHIRPKLPAGLTPEGGDPHVAPWHQDAGVTWADADPYFILTVWIPLTEATVENGCLQIIPRTHGKGLLKHHTKPGMGTVIMDEEMPASAVLTLPMSKGDLLLMHKEIPHRSTANTSDNIRWSMDLRYQQTGTPTGRPFHPEFVARSRTNPESVLTDHAEWARRWAEALERGKGMRGHRWN